jgi:hypothetical protein
MFLYISFTSGGGAAAFELAVVVSHAIVAGDLFTGGKQTKSVELDPLPKDPYKAVR